MSTRTSRTTKIICTAPVGDVYELSFSDDSTGVTFARPETEQFLWVPAGILLELVDAYRKETGK